MCIPFQIIGDSDPKTFDTFDIFQDRSFQSICSVDLFLSVSLLFAFDRLKSHIPFPCPASQLIDICLKLQCVLYIINFSVVNTVIRKESYFRIDVCWDIINVQGKKQGTKDSALRDTWQNRASIRFCSVYNLSLLSVAQKRAYPFQCLTTYAVAKQFALKSFLKSYQKLSRNPIWTFQFVLRCPRL